MQLPWGTRTYLMGIINVTPDSFSGDGIGTNLQTAVQQAVAFAQAGADMIDIGGESTRPGHAPVEEAEEVRRVIPAIAAVRKATALPISVDTFKPAVAEQAVSAGADMINCVWGTTTGIAEVAARANVPLVIMHNQKTTTYAGDCVSEVIASLAAQAQHALVAGIESDKIIVDPGIGFGKTPDDNVRILQRLHEFVDELPYPLLVGVSRKSFIGKITGLPVGQRVFGTAAAVALSIGHGADIVRVHDVAEMRGVVDVTDAIVRIGAARSARGTDVAQ